MTRSLILLGAFACSTETPKTGTPDVDSGADTGEPAADTGDACTSSRWWRDADHDGVGDPASPVDACAAPADHVDNADDCDDTNPDAFPGNPERCDGIDQDCTGDADDGLLFEEWWPDTDGDGFGAADLGMRTCDGPPAGWIAVGGDCADSVSTAHPGADASSCDRIDTDCDGVVEEQRVPEDHADLQAAIDAAADGGLVCVAAGTWPTGAVLDGKTLVIRGEGAVLQGTGGTVLALHDAGATELTGFVITGGEGEDGAGLRITDSAPTLSDLEVSGNRCVSSGAGGHCAGVGISIEGSTAVLGDVVVSDNTALASSSVRGVGVYVVGSVVTLADVTVSGNVGDGSIVQGVGLAVDAASTLGAERLWLLDNVGNAETHGPGVALDTCLSPPSIASLDLVDLVVTGNEGAPGSDSGIVSLCGGESDRIVRLTLQANRADTILRARQLVIHNLLAVDNDSEGSLVDGIGTLSLEQATIASNRLHGDPEEPPPLLGDDLVIRLRNSILSDNRWDAGGPQADEPWAFGEEPDVRYADLFRTGEFVPVPARLFAVLTVDPLLDADWRALSPELVDAGDPTTFDPDGTIADLGIHGGPNAFP